MLRRTSLWVRAIGLIAACGIVAIVAIRYFTPAPPTVPRRVLRIGFEENPPVQTRTANGYAGLSVETVRDAAKRAGIELEWIETGKSSEESLRKGLVDLWPLVVDLPERRKYIHFARPWMHSSYVLLLREDTEVPDRDFRGPLAAFQIPLNTRLVRELFPKAEITGTAAPPRRDHHKLCTGSRSCGVFRNAHGAKRVAGEARGMCFRGPAPTYNPRPETSRRVWPRHSEMADAADRIQDEIGKMYPGRLASGSNRKVLVFWS